MKFLRSNDAEMNDPQASSVVSYTSEPFPTLLYSPKRPKPLHCSDPNCYEKSGTGCFAIYAIEYKPGFDDAVCISRLVLRMDWG